MDGSAVSSVDMPFVIFLCLKNLGAVLEKHPDGRYVLAIQKRDGHLDRHARQLLTALVVNTMMQEDVE